LYLVVVDIALFFSLFFTSKLFLRHSLLYFYKE